MAHHRSFAALLASAVLFGWTAHPALLQAKEQHGRPNILLIVADDLGYADIGVHGCRDIPTPHIDSIARNGIRCTDG